MPETIDIAASLADIRRRIAQSAKEAGRDPETVTLVAVSKTKPAEQVLRAVAAGQQVFGENRVQEAEGKYPAVKQDNPGVILQGNEKLLTNYASRSYDSSFHHGFPPLCFYFRIRG